MRCGRGEMYRELLDYQPLNGEREIRRVESREHVQAFVDVIASVWGCQHFYKAIYDTIPLSLIQEGASLELYLLFWEGKPVTSGMLLFHANVAGIYYVGTHPEYRCRELGREMTDHLLSRAQAKGYKMTTLQASKEGKPLYERLGFISTCRFIEYSNVAD